VADRSVVVRLRAEVAGYKAAMEDAAKSTQKVGKEAQDAAKTADTGLGRMVQSAQKNREAWTTAGATLTVFGGAAVAGLGFATHAAMSWESAWTGVLKTVEGTPAQLAAVEDGLRAMARELPASHEQIAAVAEAAGQLGVSTDGIVSFTRTMIDLGETTNLQATDAAMSLAKFAAVVGTSEADIPRLGASIVGLGNNFATTEADIVQMATRLSAAGAIAGFTEPQILGLSAAMSSIGIEAEAGGTAMSQTIQTISKAVIEGGDDVAEFARIAGMSASDFSAKWKSDPVVALDAVIGGLARMNESGENTYQVLEDLGVSGIRQVGML
jgi:TP901 family phage tail tape measure protein